MAGLDEGELRHRAVAGVRTEVAAFGTGHADAGLIERPGLLAALSPATPQRSIFNSVHYSRAAALSSALADLAEAYERAGVEAWTVWVPDSDREVAELLAGRGHSLDGAPRAMAVDLSAPRAEPRLPDGVRIAVGDPGDAALLNDLAYGYGPDGFRSALADGTRIRWLVATLDGEPISCAGSIAGEDDVCITGVATPPRHRGRGLASCLVARALEEAREAGARSANLRASKAGAPVYERLGFRDLGFVELWELRQPLP